MDAAVNEGDDAMDARNHGKGYKAVGAKATICGQSQVLDEHGHMQKLPWFNGVVCKDSHGWTKPSMIEMTSRMNAAMEKDTRPCM